MRYTGIREMGSGVLKILLSLVIWINIPPRTEQSMMLKFCGKNICVTITRYRREILFVYHKYKLNNGCYFFANFHNFLLHENDLHNYF